MDVTRIRLLASDFLLHLLKLLFVWQLGFLALKKTYNFPLCSVARRTGIKELSLNSLVSRRYLSLEERDV